MATCVRLIPRDPNFIPEEQARTAAVDALYELLPQDAGGYDIECDVYPELELIDAGENMEAVICPACEHRTLLLDTPDSDSMYQWARWLFDPDDFRPIARVTVAMPCCGSTQPVTALGYDWPVGFARFEICVWDPGLEHPIGRSIIGPLEKILGCSLEQIWAHY